ncbi:MULTISPECIES: NuoM family protein [Kribbella]|uniref:NADH dehydrogenase subunit M n=1 Tax=Kribbella pratensis TaxID=2512112 RepID=A0ABY2FBQ2_9ACTN|nr:MULTISPECIES: NADH-quinone oxidoreductase subunit M [Kribbella]TDW88022.1 NADH dehydrogenase subunit M [Kribbella pratensis]TDW88765.1 NADH dehydrogenase subunit M [Kribbella sp. VKM Ac-2566]
MNAVLLAILVLPLLAAGALWSIPAAIGDRLAAAYGSVISGLVLIGSVLLWPQNGGWFAYGPQDLPETQIDVAWIPSLGVRFHLGVDSISVPLIVLTALLTFLCCLYSLKITPRIGRTRSLIALLLVIETGVIGTFSALDLVLFFVCFEIVLIPMWLVIDIWGDHHDAAGRKRAANTFVLMTVFGSALMLLGFLLVQRVAGTLDIVELTSSPVAGGHGIPLVAALLIAIGLAVKVPLWPLHIWLPDAHAKAPTVGSVLLAGVLLKLGTYGMIRILVPVLPDATATIAPYLGAFSTVAIVAGSLACLAQTDVKRLIAYSSVGHMGFIGLGISTLSPAGLRGALFANIAHGLITGLLFFLAGAIKDRHDTSDLRTIGRALYARLPRIAALLTFACLASLGLPGLAGFWGEMLVLLGAYNPAPWLPRTTFLVFMVIAGLGTVLTAAYFLRLVRNLCQGDPAENPPAAFAVDLSRIELVTWAPLITLTVLLGLWPGLLLQQWVAL